MTTDIPNIKTHTAITTEDKFTFTFKSTSVKYWWPNHNKYPWPYWVNRYTLKRYYAHDRFSIEKDIAIEQNKDLAGFINVNNGTDYKFYRKNNLSQAMTREGKWLVHWSNWKSLPFSKLTSLTVGDIFGGHNYGDPEEHIGSSSTLFIDHHTSPKKFIIDTDKYMKFILHEDYTFKNIDKNEVDKSLDPGNDDKVPRIRAKKTQTEYPPEAQEKDNKTDILLYFPKVDQLKNNKDLVYVFGEDFRSIEDFAKQQINADGNFIETPYGKLDLTYTDRSSELKVFDSKNGASLYLIGVFSVNDYVKYNFAKKQAEKNMSHGASRGVLVPYNFYGEWNMKLHLSLNEVYKDLTINVHQNIDKPILDPHIGQVQLKITDDDFVAPEFLDKPMGIIKSSYFKDIIESFHSIYALDRRFNNEEK